MKKKHFISIKNKIILALLPIIVVTYGLVCTLTVMRMNTEITEELYGEQEVQRPAVLSAVEGVHDADQ